MSTDEPSGDWRPPPSPPPPPPPPPYGQPAGYGYAYNPYAAPQTEGMAVAALITAIASWVACPVIPAIVALVLASSARKKIAESGGRLTGEGLLTATKWIAWLHLGLWAAGVVFFIMLAVFSAVADDEYQSGLDSLILGVSAVLPLV